MGGGDRLDEGQPEADAGVVGVDPLGAAPEGFGEGRDEPRGERLAGVLHRQHDARGPDAGVHPHTALGQVVDDRVLHEVGGQLQQEGLRSERGRDVTGGLDGDAAPLREGEQRLGRLLRQQ